MSREPPRESGDPDPGESTGNRGQLDDDEDRQLDRGARLDENDRHGTDDTIGGNTPARSRIAESAAEELDDRIVDLLSWILETETRAKIYVHLLATPESTSEEIAIGTGLYPSTVREALATLHEEGHVDRDKRSSEGAGNNPFEYTATPPSELVSGVIGDVQQQLNTIFTLDRVLERGGGEEGDADVEPITITVESDLDASSFSDEDENE